MVHCCGGGVSTAVGGVSTAVVHTSHHYYNYVLGSHPDYVQPRLVRGTTFGSYRTASLLCPPICNQLQEGGGGGGA